MKSIALKKKYLIKESISPASLHESYMIIDPDSNTLLAEVVEEATFKQKLAKLFVDKGFLPVKLVMRNDEGEPLLEISSPASFVKSVFTVKNSDGRILCVLRQKCSFIKPEIIVEDGNGQLLGTIEGRWNFKNFIFKDTNMNEIATIKHLFAGLTQELFTTADDYEVNINSDPSMSLITLAAVICIDFMYHES